MSTVQVVLAARPVVDIWVPMTVDPDMLALGLDVDGPQLLVRSDAADCARAAERPRRKTAIGQLAVLAGRRNGHSLSQRRLDQLHLPPEGSPPSP